MKLYLTSILISLICFSSWSQNQDELQLISGEVLNAANDLPLDGVNIVNTTRVKGSITDEKGRFTLMAHVNDTLFFQYLGFKPIQVKITEDWVKFGEVKIKMTEAAIALEEVTVKEIKLTGFLEIDAKNIPIYDDFRYSISGLNYGYEGGKYQKSAFSKTLESVFNPADFLYKTFGRKGQEMKKLRKMKDDDEIRNILQDKYDQETLAAVLGISKPDIEEILKRCDYSREFIKTANDLQILDAISGCYEEYKAINR
ncbi:carboxypeptidase-like regulatory domain-containing protein [Psychroflexus planctonicus]|uniref:Membrane protein n=1 Tax=Psychroflexus planctonicus TaxID=1526575 RepID=A0ABQ1SJZ4_9FLAO|nr:carboxypeptidase-like regulatory domain-containing protein [Psychroflexus planctonicus]GGE43252.1 membrane protein [Psychroflexus planctonicus]